MEDFRYTSDGKFIQASSHTCMVLNHKSRNKVIIKAVCDLRKIDNIFDSIACCGTSGLMVVPQIAELLKKDIVVVRKSTEKSYSDYKVEGVNPYRYIILDDLICSGRTVRHIRSSIHAEIPRAKCVGVYCYIPQECAYVGEDAVKLCKRDLGVEFLNPCLSRT